MAQITKNDFKQVLKEVGVVTKDNLRESLKDFGVVTKSDLKEMGMVTEKVFKRELNKTTRKLQVAIANVALNSPTIKQFNELEKRVSGCETFAN